MTLNETTLAAYDAMPEEFYSSWLVTKAKQINTHKRYAFADTFMRQIRHMRAKGILDYKIISHKEGLYQKLKPTT